jgi:hypothetical protein
MLGLYAAPVNAPPDQNPYTAAPWINKENPQYYHEFASQWNLPNPKRHILGTVGGNEVSMIAGNQQDIESDLKGITRPWTWCQDKKWAPLPEGAKTLTVQNRKTNLTIDVRPVNLPDFQMWAYAGAYKPLPLVKDTCGVPHKY